MKRALNLGAGNDIRPKEEGWTNVDARDLPGVDVVLDLTQVWPDEWFARFDEVVAQDLIEHLPPWTVPDFLSECFDALKPGGVLRLRYPDLFKIFRRAISGGLRPEEAVLLVYGDQSEATGGSWGAHRWGFTDPVMVELLGQTGFVEIAIDDHTTEHNKYVTAAKP